jgi:catechol 2,3-dioxygenase-like lactoylglutathione lyase family enzyme
MFDAMVSHGRLGLSKFVDLTATAPARLYGLTTKGHIAPGYDADLTLWDPEQDRHLWRRTTCTTTWATTRGRALTVTGWPKHVLLRGRRSSRTAPISAPPAAANGSTAPPSAPARPRSQEPRMTRPDTPNILAITFLYYKDLARAEAFYRDVMGFPLVIDQDGLAKIMKICDGAHVGLVDEAHGMHKWAETRPVQLCMRVGDVDAWYAYAKAQDLAEPLASFSSTTPSASAPSSSTIPRATRSRSRRRRGPEHEHALRHQPQLDAGRHRRHRRGHRPAAPHGGRARRRIACLTLAEGPPGIESQAQADLTIPHLLTLAESLPDAAAFVIACFGDPGLHALRDRTAKPVLGIQEAAVTTALTLGQRFGVIAILPASIPRHLRAFGAMGVMDRLAGDRALNLGVTELADADTTLPA